MKIDPLHYPEKRLKDLISNSPPKLKQIIALTYASGARVSELNQIKKEDIFKENNYLKISCPVLKKKLKTKENIKRVALIRLDETWLVNPIVSLCMQTKDGQTLVPYSRNTLFRWLKKHTGINPHGFRAIRATHLAQKGFSAHQLKLFFGWSSVAPSDYYVRLNTRDIEY